jgi:hypothetical protein
VCNISGGRGIGGFYGFAHGVGKGHLGFSSTAGLSPEVPLLLFVILFGLSMDHHVFILSRIGDQKIRVRDQGVRPMSLDARGGKLDACLATCSTTATSRASAASPSRPSRDTRARSATS